MVCALLRTLARCQMLLNFSLSCMIRSVRMNTMILSMADVPQTFPENSEVNCSNWTMKG